MANVEKFLEQSGVLGMHWGQHLPGKTEVSHNPPRMKAEPHPDHVESRRVLKKQVSTVSTRELQETNKRLQAELQLTDLKAKGSTISKGQKQIAIAIGVAGTATTIYNMAQSPAGKAAIKSGSSFVKKLLTKA